MSEIHAAVGLAVIDQVPDLIKDRKRICDLYDLHFFGSTKVRRIRGRNVDQENFAYYPILLPSESSVLKCLQILRPYQIFPRRYFYPSLNRLRFLTRTNPCPQSEQFSAQVLCLPLAAHSPEESIRLIADTVLEAAEIGSQGERPY